MVTHELKIRPEYFIDIKIGVKKFEMRKDDRNFRVGDMLLLREFDWHKEKYTGESIEVLVSYKFDCMEIGAEGNYCVLGIKKFIRMN